MAFIGPERHSVSQFGSSTVMSGVVRCPMDFPTRKSHGLRRLCKPRTEPEGLVLEAYGFSWNGSDGLE